MYRANILLLCLCALAATSVRAEELLGIENPLHGYYTKTPHDRFTRFNEDFQSGRRTLDTSGEQPLLRSLLAALDVPVSSQMLVFSVTSLQKNLISPRRPRALYFNDDTYVAFVPGGRVEVISLDPELGSIFYISDRVTPGQPLKVKRSEECMNCHSPHYLENIPALLVESVVPGMTGGGEKAFRREQTGHQVPLSLRFGGWHVTGTGANFPSHWGNKLIDRYDGVAHERPIEMGELFDVRRYLLPTSDVLPQLIQEHQVGFANRAILASYRARVILSKPAIDGPRKLAALAEPLVRYMLFTDETPLPDGSVTGTPEFRADFAARRRPAKSGLSLKDLDLTTRLFRYRCSYMIYSPVFTGLPRELKQEVYRQLVAALSDNGTPAYTFLPRDEKQAIRSILQETLPDLQSAWRTKPAPL